MFRLLYKGRGTRDGGRGKNKFKVQSSRFRVFQVSNFQLPASNHKSEIINHKWLWAIVYCLCTFSSAAQQANNYSLIKIIPIKGTYLKIDNFGNTYVVNDKNELHKFKPNGEFVKFYNVVGIGKIGFVDVSNAMKVLAYYPRYTTIKILDVTLSDKASINLLNLGFDRVNAMCLALDNNIWIYDEIGFRLKKIDDNLNIKQQSEDLTTQLQLNVRPNFMLEKDNLLFVNDPEIGILVFDIYSTYIKTIPIKGLKEFQKLKDLLIYYHEGKLHSYHLKTLAFSEIPLPETTDNITDVKVETEHLAMLTENELLLYKFLSLK
jgi:hypothetical protein